MIKEGEIFRRKKAQLNISFAWLFAIIVGGTILVLVIFGVTKLIKTGEQESEAVGSAQISILLNPLETGFESATSQVMQTSLESRIYNRCTNIGEFGEQRIKLQEFTFNKWQPPGIESSFENKYLFSEKIVGGDKGAKKFYLFSKPFEYPFKIADLIYLTSENDKYCFQDAPEEIVEEISQLSQKNLASECETLSDSANYKKICFDGGQGCLINVDYDNGFVFKSGQNPSKIYFETDALMYAAIFSDNLEYECQIKRITKRVNLLASLYGEKSSLMAQRGCPPGFDEELGTLAEFEISSSENSQKLSELSFLVEDITKKNKFSQCKLW